MLHVLMWSGTRSEDAMLDSKRAEHMPRPMAGCIRVWPTDPFEDGRGSEANEGG